MGQKKRIGLAAALRRHTIAQRRDQLGIGLGRGVAAGVGVAHHALGHAGHRQPGVRRQRALHQLPAHPHPKAACGQLDPKHAPERIELQPLGLHPGARLRLIEPTQGQDAIVQPNAQAGIVAVRAGHGQDMGDGLGQITDGLVARLKQPVGHARHLAGQLAQHGQADHPLGPATGQHIHGPGGIGPIGLRQMALQRSELGGRRGRGVEFGVQVGKLLHAPGSSGSVSSTGSPPYWV